MLIFASHPQKAAAGILENFIQNLDGPYLRNLIDKEISIYNIFLDLEENVLALIRLIRNR